MHEWMNEWMSDWMNEQIQNKLQSSTCLLYRNLSPSATVLLTDVFSIVLHDE